MTREALVARDVLIVTYQNLGNRRKFAAQMRDVRLLAAGDFPGDHGPKSAIPHALLFVEAVGRIELDGWQTVQARRRDGSWAGEAWLIRDDVPLLGQAAPLAALNRLGQRIRDRTFPVAVVPTPFRIAGRRRLKLIGVHMPIRATSPLLRAAYKARLRLRCTGRRWLSIGDRNERHPGARVAGELIAGKRIDLAYGSKQVARRVLDTRQIQTGRPDDHPILRIVLG